jgi:hypothetical protein
MGSYILSNISDQTHGIEGGDVVLPAMNSPNNSPDGYADLSYSQSALMVWAVRVGYIAGVIGMLFFAMSAAHLMRDDNSSWLIKGLAFIVAASLAMISGRDYVYRIDVIGGRLLMQTAFSKKEYRMSELIDIYKKGDFQGGFAWIIKTSDCDYKFDAKDVAARNFLDKLSSRVPSARSQSWLEFSMTDFAEKRLYAISIFLFLCGLIACSVGHALLVGTIFLLCAFMSAFSMALVARQVKVSQAGLTVVNLLKKEKMIPWQSITSLRRSETGAIFLNSAQGKFILAAVEGSNVLVQKITSNIAPKLVVDHQNPATKLNQKNR